MTYLYTIGTLIAAKRLKPKPSESKAEESIQDNRKRRIWDVKVMVLDKAILIVMIGFLAVMGYMGSHIETR